MLFLLEDLQDECVGHKFHDISDGGNSDSFKGLIGRGESFREDHGKFGIGNLITKGSQLIL